MDFVVTLLQTIFAGLVGTAFMSALMGAIHSSGWANADMIRALGSLLSRSEERAFGLGLLVHATSGVLFAVPYTMVLSGLGYRGIPMELGLGALMGLAHGLVVSLLLLAFVSEKHPVERFRKVGFEVAIAHIAGHIAYGIGVALVAQAFAIHWGLHA